MADITPTPEWSDVYQLETTDDVLAGPEGLANIQAKQLANRTELLKKKLDASVPTYDTPEAGVDPVTGVQNGAYYNVRSPEDDSFLVEYQNIGGVPTPTGKSYPSAGYVQKLSQQLDDISAAVPLPYDPNKSYNIGERVELANGDAVSSKKNNNASNPNNDMTDWVKVSDGSQVRINEATKASVIYADEYNLLESEDNTPVYNQIIADAAEGAKIVFPFNKTLLGHFISENKALKLDLNGSTLTNTVGNKPIIQIGSLIVNEYSVVESVLNHGDTQFTVPNASTLFNVGDIGYLWDGATRSTTGNVNYETVKIKSISGNVITVENFMAAYKGASAIRFYHSATQLKGVELKNVVFKPTPTHTAHTSIIANCETIRTDNIETEGTTGSSVHIRYCYDVISTDTRPLKAAAVSSGQGYGYQLFGVSKFTVNSVKGSGMRHVYDQDSAYFGIIRDIGDDDDKSAPVTLAHNGFAGYILCENIQVTTSQYPVVLGEQGYGGTVPALKQNHPFRSIHVKNVVARIRADVDPSTNTGVYGVYFQNSVVGCSVDGIDVDVLNANAMTATSGSCLVRVNGVVNKGLTLNNLKANKIGRVFAGTGGVRSGFDYDNSKTVIRNVSVGDCGQAYLAQGLYYMDVDAVSIGGTPKAMRIGFVQPMSGDTPLGVFHGDGIDYIGGGVAQLESTASVAIAGRLPKGTKTAAAGITLVDGQTITINEIQEKSSWIRLNPPSGTATISVTMPKPQTVSDEVSLSVPAGRNNVTLTGVNMNAPVTINASEVVILKVVGSKWSLVSRSTNI